MKTFFLRPLFIGTALLALGCAGASCAIFTGKKQQGAVTYYSSIPDLCSTTRGLKQKTVVRATTENELRSHYGLTFLIRFQDGVTRPVYGTLYYQNEDLNRYCMATPDGRFAVFSNSRVNGLDNIIQEICFPIKDC